MRFYAPSRLEKLVPEKILDVSNFHPSHANMDDMIKYRIIVVTLVTAGKLASAGKYPQHAQWILNRIEKTFNGTFAG